MPRETTLPKTNREVKHRRHIRICVHRYIDTFICMGLYVYVAVHIHTYTYVYIYMYMCIYIL